MGEEALKSIANSSKGDFGCKEDIEKMPSTLAFDSGDGKTLEGVLLVNEPIGIVAMEATKDHQWQICMTPRIGGDGKDGGSKGKAVVINGGEIGVKPLKRLRMTEVEKLSSDSDSPAKVAIPKIGKAKVAIQKSNQGGATRKNTKVKLPV